MKQKLWFSVILVLVLSFSLSSCGKKENTKTKSGVLEQNSTKEVKDSNSGNNEEKQLDVSLYKGNYSDVISSLENKGIEKLTEEEKLKLIYSYLNQGNYYYKPKEAARKANLLLSKIEENVKTLYYKGYAKEINKDFSGALKDYNKALTLSGITNKEKSMVLNQIGHVYDLKGDFDKVFDYYNKALKLDKENPSAISNLARYFSKKGSLKKAKKYMEKSLFITRNSTEKSEIYYGLSNLELRLNGLNPDIEKSIEYAKKSIESYPNYPMGYIAYAKGLYMQNDKKYYDEIEKNLKEAIRLNPNSTSAYEFYALLEFDKKNYDNVEKYIFKAMETIDKNVILMKSDIENYKNRLFGRAVLIGKLRTAKNDNDIIKFIKESGGIKSPLILTQLKRKNYGTFYNLKDNPDFQEILKEKNN